MYTVPSAGGGSPMRAFLIGLLALTLAGCATREVGTVRPVSGEIVATQDPSDDEACPTGKVVWITIDGTSNTPLSRTAAARLHEMVEAYSYTSSSRPLAIWYAEGVGSADHDLMGKALGVGGNSDIKKAYAFLTQVWRPCDQLFLNGFSRGAFSVRALSGLLYMAGIPDLSRMRQRERNAIVDDLFDAYKTRKGYPTRDGLGLRRADRIKAVYAKHGLDRLTGIRRMPGYNTRDTMVNVEAMTIWDTVQALGLPDGSENPTEGPAHFLLTACNTKAIFQPLALDDNRVYSFTPILAGGDQALDDCTDGQGKQNVSKTIEEVWFSGAHADVGGTYGAGPMLDGELASISLNWILSRLQSDACPECSTTLALPAKIEIPEDRLSAIHDGKRTSTAYRKLYRQSRKPSVYWYHVYGPEKPIAIHASVLDRFEQLFALDYVTPGCDGTKAPGNPVICAQEIASHGLIPELYKRECLQTSDWGYQLTEAQKCVTVVGERAEPIRIRLATCMDEGSALYFQGWVYDGSLEETNANIVERKEYRIPYPRCMKGHILAPFAGARSR